MLRTENFILRLSVEERRALDELAAQRERTRSALLRDLVLAEAQAAKMRATLQEVEEVRARHRQEMVVPA